MSKIKIISVLLTALAFVSFPANASLADKREVLAQAEKYATSIACATSFDWIDNKTSVNNVHKVWIDNGMLDNYIVHWAGDRGCLGGVVNFKQFVTLFSRSDESAPFVVSYDDMNEFASSDMIERINNSLDDTDVIFAHSIEGIDVTNDGRTIVITANDMNDDDKPMEPSLTYKIKVSYSEKDKEWHILSKEYLR